MSDSSAFAEVIRRELDAAAMDAAAETYAWLKSERYGDRAALRREYRIEAHRRLPPEMLLDVVARAEPCTLCRDVGWILDCNDIGKPGPRMVELLPCLIPDCTASGQPLQSVQMKGPEFDRAAHHPKTGRIMAAHR